MEHLVTADGLAGVDAGNHPVVRNGSMLGGFASRTDECSDFIELARRMSIPADVAMHEFMELVTRVRPDDPEPVASVELATIDS